MNQAQISLIFPTFERPEEVIYNLEWFRENITASYEVFILDNSLRPMSFSFRENEHYIFLDQNMGTASRNIGIERATAPLCLLLDDDSHPFPGVVEKLIEYEKQAPENIAGFISEIHNPDGGREASLLPTVFHGAGVAFRTDIFHKEKLAYPQNFCFYGEEYRLSLDIYKAAYRLEDIAGFKVMHRRSDVGRDLNKIFYYLGRNNRIIWEDAVPLEYREQVLYDSQRRYELTANKEKVAAAFEQGISEELCTNEKHFMNCIDFEDFALLSKLRDTHFENNTALFCGTGKFPTLWADNLKARDIKVIFADFNPGLIGQTFGDHTVLSPDELLHCEGTYISWHNSLLEQKRWSSFLGNTTLLSSGVS